MYQNELIGIKLYYSAYVIAVLKGYYEVIENMGKGIEILLETLN